LIERLKGIEMNEFKRVKEWEKRIANLPPLTFSTHTVSSMFYSPNDIFIVDDYGKHKCGYCGHYGDFHSECKMCGGVIE